MNCPVCQVPLVMTDRQGVEIDYCPQCRGVWLDRGELDKIIERSAGGLAAEEASPPYEQDYDRHGGSGHHGGYGRRRRGFLRDLFDFD